MTVLVSWESKDNAQDTELTHSAIIWVDQQQCVVVTQVTHWTHWSIMFERLGEVRQNDLITYSRQCIIVLHCYCRSLPTMRGTLQMRLIMRICLQYSGGFQTRRTLFLPLPLMSPAWRRLTGSAPPSRPAGTRSQTFSTVMWTPRTRSSDPWRYRESLFTLYNSTR